jgi:hypothetical protein
MTIEESWTASEEPDLTPQPLPGLYGMKSRVRQFEQDKGVRRQRLGLFYAAPDVRRL